MGGREEVEEWRGGEEERGVKGKKGKGGEEREVWERNRGKGKTWRQRSEMEMDSK